MLIAVPNTRANFAPNAEQKDVYKRQVQTKRVGHNVNILTVLIVPFFHFGRTGKSAVFFAREMCIRDRSTDIFG